MSILRQIIRNESNINQHEYDSFLTTILQDRNSKCSLTAFLSALSSKPLNISDVINFVSYIENTSPRRYLSVSDRVINIVGTGGGISTFNISTSASFVAASAGAMVLKSGSHAHNSNCGSLDVLTNLGINLDLTDEVLQNMLAELSIGFVGPKMYSPVLRRMAISIMPLSLKEIGGFINTIGPLLCPFHVKGQICGVRSYDFVELFSKALQSLELHNSIAVWSEAGLDEFSAIGLNHFSFINDDIRKEVLNPVDYGFNHNEIKDLSGGSAKENSDIMKTVLNNRSSHSARDTVVLNAAFILLLSETCESKEEAIQLAMDAITGGKAYRLLQNTIDFSNDYAIKASA
jgi:anthranilate phosphoribosyltransferase